MVEKIYLRLVSIKIQFCRRSILVDMEFDFCSEIIQFFGWKQAINIQ